MSASPCGGDRLRGAEFKVTRMARKSWATNPDLVRFAQEGCGGLGGENPAAFPQARPIFQQPFSLPESAQTLAGIAFRAAGKSGNHFPAALKFAGKPFQQGTSDSHSLLEFSDLVRFIIGTGPPDPTLESASPSPLQGSIWHQNRAKSGNRYRINVEPMPNRPQRWGGRGGFEGGVRGACAYNKPHNPDLPFLGV